MICLLNCPPQVNWVDHWELQFIGQISVRSESKLIQLSPFVVFIKSVYKVPKTYCIQFIPTGYNSFTPKMLLNLSLALFNSMSISYAIVLC